MEEERDVVVFSDDEGNEFELEVVDYFDHDGQEYAVLMDTAHEEGEEPEEDDTEVYIMKIVVTEGGDMEEFLPADEDKMDELIAIVEKRFEEWDEEDGCECGDDCDCEHEHEHGCSCGCGCEEHKD